MDTIDAIATKLETRQFDLKKVPDEVKMKVLEAARLTGSSNNTQHWRFILLDDPQGVSRLADEHNRTLGQRGEFCRPNPDESKSQWSYDRRGKSLARYATRRLEFWRGFWNFYGVQS